MLNEPRGGVFRHVNLLVPAKDPRAQMGFIIMEPEDTPPMSGSNCICVATVLLDAGILPMVEPETRMVLEAPAGLVEVTARCSNGKAQSITLKNGSTLRFMSGGGGDKKRSAFTGRVMVFTEVDGMDEAGESSREADPISQIEARGLSYGSRAISYLECTVSTEKGRTWQEYTKGSQSRIVVQCKSCGQWVTPEREEPLGIRPEVRE